MQLQLWDLNGPTGVASVYLPTGNDRLIRLVSPSCPTGPGMAREKFQVRTRGTCFDQFVLFVGFAGVLPLSRFDHVHLRPCWLERSHATADTEKQHFRDIAEVEPHPSSIRTAVLATLCPDNIGDIAESPGLYHLEAVRK